ncbi:8296_t:CDS:2, partial [Cetraspora pellucida]
STSQTPNKHQRSMFTSMNQAPVPTLSTTLQELNSFDVNAGITFNKKGTKSVEDWVET